MAAPTPPPNRLPSPTKYGTPSKVIRDPEQMPIFRKSELFAQTVAFISKLNQSVKGVAGLSAVHSEKLSRPLVEMCKILDSARSFIREFPPVDQAQRFGNKSFRKWHAKLVNMAVAFHNELLPKELIVEGAGIELTTYFVHSFGSFQRIDYGTGHELCFVTWLTALFKLEVLHRADLPNIALVVFDKYLQLMRQLQTVYWLEPAGSKGVWGLDDYQFLPFLWGSSQLIGNEDDLTPSAVLEYTDEQAGRYMYLDAVRFVNTVKRGPFHEHSPILHRSSQAPNWEKVNQSLVKMYDAEVLNKFPVVQHIMFGHILSDHPSDRYQDPDLPSPSSAVAKLSRNHSREDHRRSSVHGPGIEIASVHSRLPLASSPSSRKSSFSIHSDSEPESPSQRRRRRRVSFPETYE